jgi:S1-C subfamily serine protease
MMPFRSLAIRLGGAAVAIVLAATTPAAAADVKLAEGVLDAIVKLKVEVPSDARSAETLGTEREGSGVLIDADGLIVTIGYLIMEGRQVELETSDGRTIPANIVAYDYDSGFGLVRAQTPLKQTPMQLGQSRGLKERTPVVAASYGGADSAIGAYVVSRRTFAGYWEYMLEDAIFTAPAHPQFGGAALIGEDGTLLGVGSLIVGDAFRASSAPIPGNMFLPIDALKPILGDMLARGRPTAKSKPWIGVSSEVMHGRVFITRVQKESPAAQAGLAPGDLLLAVSGQPVDSLEAFYRKLWSLGEGGVDVPLTVLKRSVAAPAEIRVRSVDRYKFLKLNQTY